MRGNEKRIAESCPACGEPAECGMVNGDETCWCFALPPALPMPSEESGARCYCRKCLQHLINNSRPKAVSGPCESR